MKRHDKLHPSSFDDPNPIRANSVSHAHVVELADSVPETKEQLIAEFKARGKEIHRLMPYKRNLALGPEANLKAPENRILQVVRDPLFPTRASQARELGICTRQLQKRLKEMRDNGKPDN